MRNADTFKRYTNNANNVDDNTLAKWTADNAVEYAATYVVTINLANAGIFSWTNVRNFRNESVAKRKAIFIALLEGADTYHGAAFLFAPRQIGYA